MEPQQLDARSVSADDTQQSTAASTGVFAPDVLVSPGALTGPGQNALEGPYTAAPLPQAPILKKPNAGFWSLKRLSLVILAALVVTGSGILFFRHHTPSTPVVVGNFNTVHLSLDDFAETGPTPKKGVQTLTVSGRLQADGSFILTPSLQPATASPGQLYYDKGANQLAYYNGSQFVALSGASSSQSTTVNNSTTTINGALNAVTSPGGTIGTLPIFTGGQTVGDSIVSQVGGSLNVGGNLNLINNAPATSMTIWDPTTVPATPNFVDANAVELGLKFQSDVSGLATGIRFYKGTQNTGAHVGNLWTRTGTLLATVNFTNETASGWQQANFSSPVSLDPATTYIVSYHTNVGFYSADSLYFAGHEFDHPPLHALQSGADGTNGVFEYSNTSTFPSTQRGGGSNYWVDVVFTPSSNPGRFEIAGAQISSSALANNYDIAKRSNDQAFTGINTFRNATDSGASFVIQDAAATPLFTADTINARITISKLIVNTDITINGHIITNGTQPPVITAGPAACTTPTVTAVGDDTAGLLTVTTGTGCAGVGKLATGTFFAPFVAAPRVFLTPANSNAAGLTTYIDSATISPTAFDLQVSGGTIADTTTYKWYYAVIQ